MDLKDMFREMGLAGTTAVIVVNFTHPIDTIKTRLQVDPNFSVKNMVRSEGASSLYKGITAAWLREASYTSIKLGMYGPIKSMYGASSSDAPFIKKFAAGATSGSIGSVVGNPMDVLKTLMITNKGKSPGLASLAKEIYHDRGISGFYRGVQANAMRATVLNGTKMGCYDQIKGYVVQGTGWSRKDLRTQFLSAGGAGFCMAVTVSPFDMLRTQLMNQPPDKKIYSGFMDCAMQTIKRDGITSLYRGFFPIWARFAPQATLQLIVFEFLRKMAGLEAI
uniref:Uncharacterized protein n=1 Tax=Mucochytrium quahogii TaxID=96639 RepID=A0A7S2RB08_9STRA|mmetsp:Transcript_18034/g.29247  ORF Transcript_18034/g.29247 Transcript_18034/m.29247 type:complete len:278 (-) Transcript_18034:1611-2444(-)|eukprot:CAMPEP_0203760824 /NCGR_PEP_ID=MMETSP0098-20131031/14033_1 /ASSEMBLY_ACC=CAM_ASM_000208 /TAXON_ID=96639 /ORGANISM=" , Strain NY0313808BC1" /LENGTH=277 /DNA_ID=CAMNT_0050654551 /DNA_START=237 /DNA_END=1070 /DNA_ORIENTATION=-